ncbi:MAG: carboxypeptidase-like regulatory domain-containing protein, partial [Calditrichaceae bacterium]
MYKLILILGFSLVFLISSLTAQPSDKGKISGMAVDAETGDPLIGANVYLENTTLGSASDLDGNFLILGVPAGKYTLIVSVVGYAETKITDVAVKGGEITKVNIAVQPEILTTEAVVVEAKAVQNTEAALLKSRQKSAAVSDAVSAEAISRAGSGNAADAMKQVTGASVVDGKYVFVRGLGDRYTSTQLNGAELPSTDPYKRSGSIDLIPSNLIDNIQTIKSFTPDKPGDFSGGAVDIKTKDFPDQLKFTVSTSASYNSQEANPSSNPANEKLLSRMTNSFNKQFAPTQWTPPLNQSYSLSTGNQVNLFNRPLGFFFGLTYKSSASSYDNAKYRRWELSSSDVMSTTYNLRDTQTKSNVTWGGLVKASYKFTPNHKISFNGMYNQDAESEARSLEGAYPYDLSEGDVFRASVLSYSERNLKT